MRLSVVFKSFSIRFLLLIGMTQCPLLVTITSRGCPKVVMVSFSKLSFIFARFIDSFESERGILLETMSTCILVLMVPMVMGIVAPLIVLMCAPSPNLYWLSLFVKTF